MESKADGRYPIVGAASIAAKVTRDACLSFWSFAEPGLPDSILERPMGSGYPSGGSTQRAALEAHLIGIACRSHDFEMGRMLARSGVRFSIAGEIQLADCQGFTQQARSKMQMVRAPNSAMLLLTKLRRADEQPEAKNLWATTEGNRSRPFGDMWGQLSLVSVATL